MALYELRTYTLQVGALGTVVDLYKNEGWPALEKYQDKIVGYFTGVVGSGAEVLSSDNRVGCGAAAHAFGAVFVQIRDQCIKPLLFN